MNDMENIKSYSDEISKLKSERDVLLAKVAELEHLLAEINESLNDERVWL